MKETSLNELKAHLRPGKTYRRADLVPWSRSVDRHLQALLREGALKKLRTGLYYCPKESVFGEVPADDRDLVRTFLKDGRFLLMSPNVYNTLGLGTTQLYNSRVVYNHKRHGVFVLGGRTFEFRVKHHFPLRAVNKAFLLVDLVNNLDELAEDRNVLLDRVRRNANSIDSSALLRAVRQYGRNSTKKFIEEALRT